MPALHEDLRKQLERVVIAARDAAEAGARAALERLAVGQAAPFEHLAEADRDLRKALRARGRALGDRRDEARKTQGIGRLTHELGYEHWHRRLFARFLAENHLLMHPDGVAVSLAD